jgi:hypothetical protein
VRREHIDDSADELVDRQQRHPTVAEVLVLHVASGGARPPWPLSGLLSTLTLTRSKTQCACCVLLRCAAQLASTLNDSARLSGRGTRATPPSTLRWR